MAKKKEEQSFIVGQVYHDSIAELPIKERRDTLESICYKVSEEGYTKTLSDEELIEKKSDLAEISISLNELENEKKNLMADIKAKMEIPLQIKKELLVAIKHKTEWKEGLLYSIDDQESGMMYIFDENAVCINIRALRQEEKQTKMRTLKSGTDEN